MRWESRGPECVESRDWKSLAHHHVRRGIGTDVRVCFTWQCFHNRRIDLANVRVEWSQDATFRQPRISDSSVTKLLVDHNMVSDVAVHKLNEGVHITTILLSWQQKSNPEQSSWAHPRLQCRFACPRPSPTSSSQLANHAARSARRGPPPLFQCDCRHPPACFLPDAMS